MGVPVVAGLGNTVASRVSAAILTSLGLTDWVAGDDEQYKTIALSRASKPEQLKALRHDLPGIIAHSSSGNFVTYCKAVEAAYRTMWETYCRQPR